MPAAVLGIFIATTAGAPMEQREEVTAIPGKGLMEDRYHDGAGSFSKVRLGTIRHLTLIEVETLEAVNGELERAFTPQDTRRNLLTRGVSLNSLVGREFFVGCVQVRGFELCEPCERPSKLSGKPGFRQAFAGRGGLRVEILTPGIIHAGDEITLLVG